ncbi:MAG TPA: hydantoinase/oxoprolinase family protein [Candidatus Dormibacteraeota bacterium]|nr:hydantoinase/oxoprolinase family protein [Candidatus Dormibacteraeota bacterium]
MSYRLGVDVGGTFTDLVLVGPDGKSLTRKVLSSTGNYAEAIVEGTRALLAAAGRGPEEVAEVIHGTTVATNAILERRGARTGLLTTAGFRDLLEIGRLRLARLYDLRFERPAPLVPRRWRREVVERLNHQGEELVSLDPESVTRAIDFLVSEGVESIAVCLLHAYANPAHEEAVGRLVRARAAGLALTLSCEILPEMREFERTSTAVTNAYVMPVMSRYLESLERDLTGLGLRAPVLVMQSNGGVMTAGAGRQRPVHVIESGPAAGVIATATLARQIGQPNAISIDMGGTTAKASVIEGYEIKRTGEFEIGGVISQGSRLNRGTGFLLRVPAIDIAEVGAGGGSIVVVDGAGQLHVGPRSAGANPGPACYAQGGREATLTDANVVLGYLHPEQLPSGLRLDAERARVAVAEQVATPLGLPLLEAAHGVYLLGCARMARAVRAVTIERGRDPREFVLVAFGGNGPLFATEMARSLEIGTVLVPPAPGVFSALGLLEAEVEHHLVRTFLRPLNGASAKEITAALDALEAEAGALFHTEGYRQPVEVRRFVDLKYQGQSFELTVPLPEGWTGEASVPELVTAFAAEHERTYGHKAEGDPIQLVNLRLTARVLQPAARPRPRLAETGAAGGGTREAYFGREHGVLPTPVLARHQVGAAARRGPLLIEEYDATTLVPPGCSARLDAHGNILITTGVAA